MARTLHISDGTLTANLIDSATLNLKIDGWTPGDPDMNQIRRETFLGEGSGLILSQAKNRIEVFKIKLQGSSHDNVAATLQTLATLQKEARDYHTTNWQRTPVYLKSQTSGESGARYALIFDIRFKLNRGLYGVIFENKNVVPEITVTIEFEPYWRGYAPGDTAMSGLNLSTIQDPGDLAVGGLRRLANQRTYDDLTHVYNYDDSAAAFSSNLVAAALPYSLFEVAGSDTAVDDAVYYGCTAAPFAGVLVSPVKPALSDWQVSTVLEYWDGSAWKNTSGATPLTGFSGAGPVPTNSPLGGNFTITPYGIYMPNVTDWAKKTVNGVNAYWLRVRVTAVTNGSDPRIQQTTFTAHIIRATAIDIANGQVKGDVDALALLSILSDYTGPQDRSYAIFWAAFGIRSRNLTYFLDRLPIADCTVPASSLTLTLFGDTSYADASMGPGGRCALCTFATSHSLDGRVSLSLQGGTYGAAYSGTFDVYLRCQQIGGNAGDITVQIKAVFSNQRETLSDVVSPRSVGLGSELLYCGRMTFQPNVGRGNIIAGGIATRFYIFAGAANATPDIEFHELIFMPVDEAAVVVASPNFLEPYVSYVGVGSGGVLLDGGVIRPGAHMVAQNSSGLLDMGEWELRGIPLAVPADREFQIYAIFATQDLAAGNQGVLLALPHLTERIQLQVVPRWALLRGAE